jgi:hypothetical protein
MSSPSLNRNIFAVGPVSKTNPKTDPGSLAKRGADAAITARAVVVVSILGAGFWYLLWKMAFYFVARH